MKERIMKRLFLLSAIIIIIIAIVIVRKQGNNQQQSINQMAEEKTYRTELRIGISAVDSFDPIISSNKNVQDVSKLIYESLVTLDENYKIKGVLATEWAKTAENSYIIKLKQGIKWHNGNEFTANDVEFTINKIKQEKNSIYKVNVENISQITIIDNYTIRLDLLNDEAFFEYNLIFPIQNSSDYTIGTGLYKINQMEQNKVELTRNQYKENIENVQIKTITVKNYSTMGEAYNDFKIGNIDIINTDNLDYSNYIGTLGYTVRNFYGRNFDLLCMNTKNTALYNIEVRKAISFAIDKNLIVSSIFNNKYYVANYPLDYGNWLYSNQDTSSGYNPEQSKKILEENGWEYKNNVWQKSIDNKNVQLKFNLLVSSNNELRIKVAESIKQQLEEVGIKINITKVSSINSYVQNKNYDIALVQISTGVSPDLSIFFGDNNLINYKNPEVISIIDEIDIPFISLYFDNSVLIYNSKIVGAITPTWYNLYYNIENWKIEV